MPTDAEWIQEIRGALARRRSSASPLRELPRSSTSASSSGPSADPSAPTRTIREPGAAAEMRARSSGP